MAIPYLITVAGPVADTSVRVHLTGTESDLVRRLAREIFAHAVDRSQPALQIKPLSEATVAELDQTEFGTEVACPVLHGTGHVTTIPYLITVVGPVAHTHVSVYLTGRQSDLVRRLAREISIYAIDENQPTLRIKPLWEATATELGRLEFGTQARLERAALTASAVA